MINKKIKITTNLISVLLTFFITLFLLSFKDETINAIIFSILLMVFLIILIKNNKTIRTHLIIGFFIRIFMALIYTFFMDSDPDGYKEMAEMFYNMDFFNYIHSFQTGAYLYSWLVGGIWKITGVNTIIIRLINGTLSLLSCLIAYKLSYNITHDNELAKKVFRWSIYYPTLIRFSSPFASRETLFVFLLTLGIYVIHNFYLTKSWIYLMLFLPISILGIITHFSFICIILFMFIIILKNIKYKSQFFKSICAISIFIIIVIIMLKNQIGTEKLYLNKGGINIEKISWIQDASAEGNAAYLQGFSTNSILLTIIQLPIRMIYFLFSPFIWMIKSPIHILGLLDGLMIILLVNKILKKMKSFTHFKKVLLLIMILETVLFAIGTSNFGTALRHRGKLIIPLIILAIEPDDDKKRRNYENSSNNA